MSIMDDWNSMENGDVVIFLKQLSDSERQTLKESLEKYLENGGRAVQEFGVTDLDGVQESEWNDKTKESENLEICCKSMASNSPVVGDMQPVTDDQSLFYNIPQTDFDPMAESHTQQFFQGHDTGSEFSGTLTFPRILDPSQPVYLSSGLEEMCIPETLVVNDWGSNSGQVYDVESWGPTELPQSYQASASPALRDTADFAVALTTPPKGFDASQRSKFDFCQSTHHPSTTVVPKQEVVKTTCEEEFRRASEVSERGHDAKKERRRLQNRTAAKRCRNRKKETFECMVKAAKKAKLENEELQKATVRLREKLHSIIEVVKLHQTHCNLQLVTTQIRSPVSASTS